jgi:hypothetical protein
MVPSAAAGAGSGELVAAIRFTREVLTLPKPPTNARRSLAFRQVVALAVLACLAGQPQVVQSAHLDPYQPTH